MPTENEQSAAAQSDHPAKRGSGWSAFLKFIPFVSPKRATRHREESEAALEKRANLAEQKAAERQRKIRVRDVSKKHTHQDSAAHGRLLSADLSEKPAVPLADVGPVSTDMQTSTARAHGLHRLHDVWKKRPSEQSSQHRGFLSFFQHLFVRSETPHETTVQVTPEQTSAAQVTMTPTPALPSLDLDDLLHEQTPATQSQPVAKNPQLAIEQAERKTENVAKELPSAELLQPNAETSKGRFLSSTEQDDVSKQAAEIGKKEAVEAKKEKDAREKAEAAQKESTREAEKKPDADDIVAAPRPKHRGGGFADFLGALKYLGVGKERISIVQNLATMLNAGLPLVDAIKTLQAEAKARPIRKLLQQISDEVENGSPLWRAMEARHFFSPHAIALIRIGEEAGNLAENMEYLSAQQEKDQALRNKVKMAMIYPAIVMTIMFIIVIGLGWFVLPNLISVLYSLNVPLPFVTRMVIAFTNLFTNYGTILVPGSVGGLLVLVILAKFTPLRVVSQWIVFRVPGMGRLAREATIARFGVILGGLLQAGVPLIDAIRSLAEVTPIVCYRKFYTKMLESITVGNSFATSFQTIRGSRKLLPPSVQQLVMTGEKSGSLAKILLKIADIYEKKANETAQRLPVILEPMLLLFIGALVGTIALAIIVPIYSIVGNVTGG